MIAFVYKNTLLFTLHLSVFVMNSLLCFDMFPEKNYLFCFFFESVLLYFLIYFYLLLFFLMSFILKLIQIDLGLRSRRPFGVVNLDVPLGLLGDLQERRWTSRSYCCRQSRCRQSLCRLVSKVLMKL